MAKTKHRTILLQFKQGTCGLPPRRWIVEGDDPEVFDIVWQQVHRDKSVTVHRYTLRKCEDGSYRSNTGCEYVQVKADRRPKPYSVESREEGRGPAHVEKFATLEELKAYVLGRWQGWDYYDGGNSFHGDYATFTVKGATLAELVPAREVL